jgi:hypothetical protein
VKVIDLHGVRYRDVYGMLEKSCTHEDLPFVVITGRSSCMKKIVLEIVATFGLEARDRLGNEGRVIVCENNRKKV